MCLYKLGSKAVTSLCGACCQFWSIPEVSAYKVLTLIYSLSAPGIRGMTGTAAGVRGVCVAEPHTCVPLFFIALFMLCLLNDSLTAGTRSPEKRGTG